jgi:hypothetical protein
MLNGRKSRNVNILIFHCRPRQIFKIFSTQKIQLSSEDSIQYASTAVKAAERESKGYTNQYLKVMS